MSFSQKVKSFFSKVWAYVKIAKVELIVIAAAIFLDLLSKGIVQATMSEGETIVVIPNFLEFCFVYNNKAAFSFDFGLSALVGERGTIVVFIIFTILAIGAFCYVLYRMRGTSLLGRISLALIIGGAVGNLYDRIFIGEVRDFIQIVYFGAIIDLPPPFDFINGRSFAIFNLADTALCIGVAACIVYILKSGFGEDEDKKKKVEAENLQPVCDIEPSCDEMSEQGSVRESEAEEESTTTREEDV